MATESVLTAIEQCKICIDEKRSFVLQGGAGSGKTESLKELLIYINQTNPKAKVMCITHTNVAVNEILSRTGNAFPVSTIHSFLNSLIKDYKKNIHTVIGELFCIPEFVAAEKTEDVSDKDYKKNEHERYKKAYEKYADKHYQMTRESVAKVTGKRDYDKTPEAFNEQLNDGIKTINQKIGEEISSRDYSTIGYNDTSFDSLKDLTFGHDGLLKVFHLLINKYPLLSKMIADRYDYIFIDEYQDTNADIICDLIHVSQNSKLTLCLFGDSMQSIYSDGIGDVDKYIGDSLISIPKPDNYRCAFEIITFVNPLRLDELKQEVAFKTKANGEIETEESRHGFAKVLYSICEQKPNAHSSEEEKEVYQSKIDELIRKAKEFCSTAKILMLTNKAIAEKNQFQNLYRIFNDRYYDVGDHMEKYLSSIQVLEFCDICNAYLRGEYNTLIKSIRLNGYSIRSLSDKKTINDIMASIVSDSNLSMWQAIELASEKKLIKLSDSCINKIERERAFIEQYSNDEFYQKFRELYLAGNNTYNKIKDMINIQSEDVFDDWEFIYKKERFINELLSTNLKFSEALNYSKYLAEETEYITMHKTKGSSIQNVIVVMDEFFWNEYKFSSLYSPESDTNTSRIINSRKLIYVACSRAIAGLVCVKVLTSDEVDSFINTFPNAEKI
ncbi:MAG: ATP-dependent helicase [Ruminococcaceae bacterium]|nr:ATP-dependent helicase [Oscillospiraceae bacterium]